MYKSIATRLQVLLKIKKVYDGPIDGIWNTEIQQAQVRYRKKLSNGWV